MGALRTHRGVGGHVRGQVAEHVVFDQHHAVALIEHITGFRPAGSEVALRGRGLRSAADDPRTADDLQFFRSLAQQLEEHSPLLKGRTGRILRLALVGGTLIDGTGGPPIRNSVVLVDGERVNSCLRLAVMQDGRVAQVGSPSANGVTCSSESTNSR